MYKKILVALENSPTDNALVPHIAELAKIHHSHLLLVNVAEGWVARNFDDLQLKESEEMLKNRNYLKERAEFFRKQGVEANIFLAHGEPSEQILSIAKREKCDLIAMTSHGHRLLADFFLGSTIEEVRHQSMIPILVVHG